MTNLYNFALQILKGKELDDKKVSSYLYLIEAVNFTSEIREGLNTQEEKDKFADEVHDIIKDYTVLDGKEVFETVRNRFKNYDHPDKNFLGVKIKRQEEKIVALESENKKLRKEINRLNDKII